MAAVRETLTDAIAKGGSTLRDYVDSAGEPGYFQLDYFVYGRDGSTVPSSAVPRFAACGSAGAARPTATPASADGPWPDLGLARFVLESSQRPTREGVVCNRPVGANAG